MISPADPASYREFHKSLPRDSPEAPDTVWNQTTGVSFDFIGVGRDGSFDSELGRSARTLLHVRCVLRQMARRCAALWKRGGTAPGRLGKTYRSQGLGPAPGDGKI